MADDEFLNQNRDVEISDGSYEWVTLKSEPERPAFIPIPDVMDIEEIEPISKQHELSMPKRGRVRDDDDEEEDE